MISYDRLLQAMEAFSTDVLTMGAEPMVHLIAVTEEDHHHHFCLGVVRETLEKDLFGLSGMMQVLGTQYYAMSQEIWITKHKSEDGKVPDDTLAPSQDPNREEGLMSLVITKMGIERVTQNIIRREGGSIQLVPDPVMSEAKFKFQTPFDHLMEMAPTEMVDQLADIMKPALEQGQEISMFNAYHMGRINLDVLLQMQSNKS